MTVDDIIKYFRCFKRDSEVLIENQKTNGLSRITTIDYLKNYRGEPVTDFVIVEQSDIVKVDT